MTAQINDKFLYNDHEYSIAGISKGTLFEPSIFDLKPAMASTACWRGYQAVFTVSKSQLILESLHINLLKKIEEGFEHQKGPVINKIVSTGPQEKFDFFNNHYENLAYPLKYTGGLLLARGFIRNLYVHMGFHPAWKYENVIELVFENGLLSNEFDRSEKMAEFRKMASKISETKPSKTKPSEDDIRAFVERAFDRTYKM